MPGRQSIVRIDDKLTLQTRLQLIFDDRPDDPTQRALHQVIMTHAVEAEKMGPGGFDACLALTVSASDLPRIETSRSLVGRRPTRSDLEKIVHDSCRVAPAYVERALWDALDNAGLGGRIIVEKTTTSVTSVERVPGHTFRLTTLIPFTGTLADPAICLVDGFIESVSEVDGILQDACASRTSLLLFARGMAPDLISTLRVNHDRGTLHVVPVMVPLELSTMNTLADISVVSGSDVTSCARGDLITSLRLGACSRIDRANVHAGQVTLVNARTRQSVVQHIADLRRRRQSSEQDELGALFDERIKSLSPGHVVLRVPGDRNFVPTTQSIDRALRGIAAAVSRGLIEHHGVPMLDDPAPVGSVAGAVLHATKCRAALALIGAVIAS